MTKNIKNTREKSHGLGHVELILLSSGVVFVVPLIKISSDSFAVCFLKTDENKSLKCNFTEPFSPASSLIFRVALFRISSAVFVVSLLFEFCTKSVWLSTEVLLSVNTPQFEHCVSLSPN